MTDCPNAEIRDLIPDWVHGTLDPGRAARVAGHVAACEACSREAAVVRAAQRLLARGPRVDVARVAAGLTARRAPRSATVRPRAAAWRIAAGVALAAAGAGTALVLRSAQDDARPSRATALVPAEVPALTLAADLTELTDGELAALGDAIAALEAAPVAEPADLLTDLEVEMEGGTDVSRE